MSELLDVWSKRVSEIASEIGKKTDETIEVQKIKSEIRSLNRGNDRDYMDIGKAIMDKFQNGEELDADMVALCEAIIARNEQIKEQEEKIAKIKGEE